jgi:hypothetical protein
MNSYEITNKNRSLKFNRDIQDNQDKTFRKEQPQKEYLTGWAG